MKVCVSFVILTISIIMLNEYAIIDSARGMLTYLLLLTIPEILFKSMEI